MYSAIKRKNTFILCIFSFSVHKVKAKSEVLRLQRAEIIRLQRREQSPMQSQRYPADGRILVLFCKSERYWADFILRTPSWSGHVPHIAGRVVLSHSLQQGNVSQQPSSFGALLFVPKVCQDFGFLPIFNCLRSVQTASACPIIISK